MKIFRIPTLNRIISFVLITGMIQLNNSCYYYKVTHVTTPPETAIPNMQAENKFIILHSGDNVWHLTNISIDENAVKGENSNLIDHDKYKSTRPVAANRYKKNRSNDESGVIHEVHIYATDIKINDGNIAIIPIKSISKIEIYDPAVGATIASWTFSIVGAALATFAVILIIAILTKSSCPFIYVNDGTGYVFTGEIFSGATQPGLERDDYLLLPKISGIDGEYLLKLSNEVHEIQYNNLTELIIADCDDNTSVLIDKYGKILSYKNPSTPVGARNNEGRDILPLISIKDTLAYAGDDKIANPKSQEEIILKFLRPHKSDSAKLIIRAKNSYWLDILFTKFHALFGEKYNDFVKKQELASGQKLRQWSLDQNIPLSVYMEKNGKWEFIDYYNIAGPMALKDDILAIGLQGINSDTVKVKLEYGFMFWEIDYAGMDFSAEDPVNITPVTLKNATDEKGTDLLNYLIASDSQYYAQKETGNEARLVFNMPPLSGHHRTVILHTRGYYKILRDQNGKPDRKMLKTFRNPGRFPEYSREMFKQFREKAN